jgi:hypothetical protein
METSAPVRSGSDRYPRAAGPIQTILVLATMGGWTIGHRIFADQLSATANPDRVRCLNMWSSFATGQSQKPELDSSLRPGRLPGMLPCFTGYFDTGAK